MVSLVDWIMPATLVWSGAGFSSQQTSISSKMAMCIMSLSLELPFVARKTGSWQALLKSLELTPDSLPVHRSVDTTVDCDREKGMLQS